MISSPLLSQRPGDPRVTPPGRCAIGQRRLTLADGGASIKALVPAQRTSVRAAEPGSARSRPAGGPALPSVIRDGLAATALAATALATTASQRQPDLLAYFIRRLVGFQICQMVINTDPCYAYLPGSRCPCSTKNL